MEQNGRKLSIWRGIAVRNDKQALTTHEGVKFAVYTGVYFGRGEYLNVCAEGTAKERSKNAT